MAFQIVGNLGEFFDLSNEADITSLSPFPAATSRYVRALDGDDNVMGSANIDQVNGNQGQDLISGATGNDYLLGGKGNDNVSGGVGDDFVAGNNNDDFVSGGEGNDILRGGKENDVLEGGDGADILVGDFGFDLLTGDDLGVFADTFVLRTDADTALGLNNVVANRAATDRITDFFSSDNDKIVLPGVQSFADIVLETVDVDGDGTVDTAIKLGSGYAGVVLDETALIQSDFIFESQGATSILNGASRALLTVPPLA